MTLRVIRVFPNFCDFQGCWEITTLGSTVWRGSGGKETRSKGETPMEILVGVTTKEQQGG